MFSNVKEATVLAQIISRLAGRLYQFIPSSPQTTSPTPATLPDSGHSALNRSER
jgi:hypothetical protein